MCLVQQPSLACTGLCAYRPLQANKGTASGKDRPTCLTVGVALALPLHLELRSQRLKDVLMKGRPETRLLCNGAAL